MSKDLARELYRSFRSHNRKNPNNAIEETRGKIEDPLSLSSAIDELISSRDWKKGSQKAPFLPSGEALLVQRLPITPIRLPWSTVV